MAKKSKKSAVGKKGLPAALVASGAVALLYAWLLPLYRIGDYAVLLALMLLIGRVVHIMASGLDTSKNPNEEKEELPVTGDEAVDALISQGCEMLAAIREENRRIPDEKLSKQMDDLEDIANRIFRTVVEQPEKAPKIRLFMDYYLPTTLKMLKGYRRMDERQVKGENANATRARIEESMDIVLRAFEKQLDTMYQDDMLDISSDISVLETLLKRDGLIDSGLHMQTEPKKQTGETGRTQGGV